MKQTHRHKINLNVGDRVKVNITEIPEMERLCEIGEVTKIRLKFRNTSKLRDRNITVIFDKNYIKEKFRRYGGIVSLSFNEKDINNPDYKYSIHIKKIS